MRRTIVLVILAASLASAGVPLKPQTTSQPWNPVATFSILGFDPDTQEIGAAVQARVFCVGNGVLWAEAGVGAVGTQVIVDVSYGHQGIGRDKTGVARDEIIKR